MTKERIIFMEDIIEDNGKTVFENNMEKGHKIPINALVEVKYDEWLGDGACLKIHARLWVYKHSRDCDGTPLYMLSKYEKKGTDEIVKIFGRYTGVVIGGFSEESLTQIEVTPDLVYGNGALKWAEKS